MVFINSIPNAADDLKDSQPQLKANNLQLDTSFGVDHYTFSNLTTDNGKHNQVTTPKIVGAAHPTTAANEPKFYAMEDVSQLGVIQYSRGPSNAVPSPVTKLQSAGAVAIGPAASILIFDFGSPQVLTASMAMLSAFVTPANTNQYLRAFVYWDGVSLFAKSTLTGSGITVLVSGSQLRINVAGVAALNTYWTLEFLRLQ